MTRRFAFASLVLSILAAGCVATTPPGQEVPAATYDFEFDVEAPRAAVFEALLSVAPSLNLSVDVLGKDSGFIQFKNSALSPLQMDRYCIYRAAERGKNTAFDSFARRGDHSAPAGAGSVSGSVSLSAVLTGDSRTTHVKLHSTWVAANRNETNQVSSTGLLERDLEAGARSKLGLAPKK